MRLEDYVALINKKRVSTKVRLIKEELVGSPLQQWQELPIPSCISPRQYKYCPEAMIYYHFNDGCIVRRHGELESPLGCTRESWTRYEVIQKPLHFEGEETLIFEGTH